MTNKKATPPPTDSLSDDAPELEFESRLAGLTQALPRGRADAGDLRRRHCEQVTGLRDMVKAGVVRDLLPVIDNLERALKHVPQELEDNDYVKGIQGVV